MKVVVKADEKIIDLLKSYGHKNYSRLQKVPIVDKNGHTRMVYKKVDNTELEERHIGNQKERDFQEKESLKLADGLKKRGYEVRITISNASWGSSTYITPYKNGEPLYISDGRGSPRLIKFRISDHRATSAKRNEIGIKNADQVLNQLDDMEKRIEEKKVLDKKRNEAAVDKIIKEKNDKKEKLAEVVKKAGKDVDWYTERIEMKGSLYENGSKKLREDLKNNKGFVAFEAKNTTSPYLKDIYFALPKGVDNKRKNATKIDIKHLLDTN